jgi:hypothetical protein
MNKCDMCNGLGYLTVDWSNSIIKDYQRKHIEKCDSCNLFDTDQQARMNKDNGELPMDSIKQIAIGIADYVQDYKKHFDAYPIDVEINDKIYDFDKYWEILDKYPNLIKEKN